MLFLVIILTLFNFFITGYCLIFIKPNIDQLIITIRDLKAIISDLDDALTNHDLSAILKNDNNDDSLL